MPWRGATATHCKDCERHVDECGPLSARYLCVGCGDTAMLENTAQLRARSGPRFRHWSRRVLIVVQRRLDADRAEQQTEEPVTSQP